MTDIVKRRPKLLTDTFCRAAQPRIVDGVEKEAKYSDSGGLYLLVKPGGSKLWQMAYRFHGRQKTYSIGAYGNGKDGGASLAAAVRSGTMQRPCSPKNRRKIPASKTTRKASSGCRTPFRRVDR